ncbi:MAG: hypothetical protein A2487_02180 [Candidatus Raymondbacteria bacterium RifOxyC12_full_50_8]|nr:MAG: hypothetical protein A2350_12505 [Candidatus Raymondbacteria bacterium RifOxyB12_full_50_8]OGK06385.1 MAG: hypothetical protein A2487_02180 [Candidatus Raymondbacteria bacterium RifOxyC12_full_50_8]
MNNILVVDDEKNIQLTITQALERTGFEVTACGSVGDARALLTRNEFELAILDIHLPDGDGLDIFRFIKAEYPGMQVIIISGAATIPQAVEAVKLGAFEILEKPLSLQRIRISVQNALNIKNLQIVQEDLWSDYDQRYQMVGKDPELKKVKDRIATVAPTQSRVLILGESGTGKELAAYAVHRQSSRKNGPFVRLNVSAVPKELIESELFGHEKGSFTGAVSQRKGKFELAHNGTIFLDEIGDMELNVQSKILRVLQENEFERLGGNRTIRVNARVICATNKNLEAMVKAGHFREDLYYRINVYPLYVPPLRDRKEDIPLLADHFTTQFCQENNIKQPQWDANAYAALKRYSFPGNIREIKNIVERIILENPSQEMIREASVNIIGDNNRLSTENLFEKTLPWAEAKPLLEKAYMEKQLQKHSGNISATARSLGMEQPNLSKKLKQLGIDKTM